MKEPITVVVPLVRAHDIYVTELVASLIEDAALIKEVIICRSGLSTHEEAGFNSLLKSAAQSVPFSVRALVTKARQTAGENRNRGASVVTTPLIAFLDADDLYARGRLESMAAVALSHRSNLVIHDFCSHKEELADCHEVSSGFTNIVCSDALYDATFPTGRNRKAEGLFPGDTNLVLPLSLQAENSIHHGHTLVRASVFERVQFSRIYPGEDGQFCRDVLWELGGVNYIPAKLSAYRSSLSAESHSTARDKAVRRLRATKDLGWRALRP